MSFAIGAPSVAVTQTFTEFTDTVTTDPAKPDCGARLYTLAN